MSEMWSIILQVKYNKIDQDLVKTLVTRYILPDRNISSQLSGFSIYPPLWTSQLVAMYDEIKNTSISSPSQFLLGLEVAWIYCTQCESNAKRRKIKQIVLFGVMPMSLVWTKWSRITYYSMERRHENHSPPTGNLEPTRCIPVPNLKSIS